MENLHKLLFKKSVLSSDLEGKILIVELKALSL